MVWLSITSASGSLSYNVCQSSRVTDKYISTSVYRKAMHTNLYLPFDLHHPVAHKASLVRTLMSRASALPSNCNGMECVAEEKSGVPESLFIRMPQCVHWTV